MHTRSLWWPAFAPHPPACSGLSHGIYSVWPHRFSTSPMTYSVIIIGAGMAGVKTALDLYQAGELNTVILESRDRLGGRLVLHKLTLNPNVSYDFGASWFHDALANPLLDKAKKLGNISYFWDDGKHVYLDKDSKHIDTWNFQTAVAEFNTYCHHVYEKNPSKPDMSLSQLFDEYRAAQGSNLTGAQAEYARQTVRLWSELWDGLSWTDTSAKGAAEDDGHLGRNAFVNNGFYSVYKNELDGLPQWYQDKNIKLNTQVTGIDYSNDKQVSVTTATGEVLVADYVVVTVPVSLLRLTDPVDECYLKWTPELPRRFTDLWPLSQFSSLGKVVFEFDKPFWPEDVHRFYVLGSDAADSDGSGKPQPWQYPSIFVNYYAMSGTPSLVALTQDPLSSQIENMTPDQIWALFEPAMRQIAVKPVIKPFNVLNTPWNKDKWVRGSYMGSRVDSNLTVLCDTLADGLNDRVRFAGAETMADSSNGCAHGAWISGEREARHIVKHMKKRSKL